MKAVALILLVSIGVLSTPLPLDPIKDFLDGAHIAFTGSSVNNDNCLDKDSQIDLFVHIVKVCADFSDYASVQKIFMDFVMSGDDVKSALQTCDVTAFTDSISDNFHRLGSEFILEKLLTNFDEIQTRALAIISNIGMINYHQAGTEFGTIFGLLFETAPDAVLYVEAVEANSFTPIFKDFTNFALGMALGFQAHATPLSACYNNTQRIQPAYNAAELMAERCLKFNFTACNQTPAMLTIFNAQMTSSYNSCKIIELIAAFEGLKDPVNLSQMVFKYFSQQPVITADKNLMDAALAKGDFYTAGVEFASIIRLLIGFSIS